jgi:hypothetical protein
MGILPKKQETRKPEKPGNQKPADRPALAAGHRFFAFTPLDPLIVDIPILASELFRS